MRCSCARACGRGWLLCPFSIPFTARRRPGGAHHRSRTHPRPIYSVALAGDWPASAVVTACAPGRLLLLAGNRLGRAFAGAGVGMSALTTDRQAAAMPQSTVAAEVHESLD